MPNQTLIKNKKTTIGAIVLFALLLFVLISWINFLIPKENKSQQKALTLTSPIIRSTDPKKGPDAAPITVVEFADFYCQACAQMQSVLQQLETEYSGKIRFVWKDLPVTSHHPFSYTAHLAARCAYKQGKFWEFHDEIFKNQNIVSTEFFNTTAKKLNLNMDEFSTCLKNKQFKLLIENNINEARALGINATPYYFINTKTVSGYLSYEEFKAIIEKEL